MTNIKAYETYLIECIDLSGYELDHLETDADKVNALHHIFLSEMGWNIARVGERKALTDWLQGLPSSITIAFYNGDIIDLAIKHGSLKADASEKMQDKILEQYWLFMAIRLTGLFNRFVKG